VGASELQRLATLKFGNNALSEMWLLRLDDNGTLSLAEFVGNDIPPYAILSHTWGEEEVFFGDILKGTGTAKQGYRKLVLCGKIATGDNLEYFWADTCCIDKRSSAELSEAINSQFLWYHNAQRCYVYLADVSCPIGTNLSSSQVLSAFRNSRWFSRSWTLQELLAPASVTFFSVEGNRIGDKVSLIEEICSITRIPIRALSGEPLSQFSIEERFSWAAQRQARREEDRVYSLLGIFDIYMPLIYGEGRSHAIKRLRREIEEHHGRHHVPISSAGDWTEDREDDFADGTANQGNIPLTLDYRPLTGNTFRLLALQPGKLGSTITGQIQEFNLLQPPPYHALSYVWGQEPELHQVFINNASKMIKPNLFHALGRIRALQKVQFYIWVDSLCINQSDTTERNAQVRRMSQIYNRASGVFIWLGEEDTTSKIAVELINTIYEQSKKTFAETRPPLFSLSHQWWRDYNFIALSLLLERPWFRRGWVLQEAAFSTSSVIQCGDRQAHIDRFSFVVRLLREQLSCDPQAMGLANDRTRVGTLMNFIDSPAVRMLDMIEGVFQRSSDGRIISHNMPLEKLVHLGTFSETSDERDVIYALLNLASDITTSLHPIIPDYRKSILGVYTDFIMHFYDQSGSLDILCRPWAPMPSSHGQYNRKHDRFGESSQQLPSWVVSRDKLPFGDPSWRSKHRLHGNSLVGSSLKCPYNAHAGSQPMVVKWPTADQPNSLFVKGRVLTTVSKRSSRMANAIVTTECLDVLEEILPLLITESFTPIEGIWRTLCADRDDKGCRAPISYRDTMLDIRLINSYNYELNPHKLDPRMSIDVEELLERPDLSKESREFLLVVRDVVWNRRTFRSNPIDTTNIPLVDRIPQDARVGDHICILYGCSVPVVLRKHQASEDSNYWQLVGDAYVHGIMDGEAIKQTSEEELRRKEKIFELR
jgi:hypothetical protein